MSRATVQLKPYSYERLIYYSIYPEDFRPNTPSIPTPTQHSRTRKHTRYDLPRMFHHHRISLPRGTSENLQSTKRRWTQAAGTPQYNSGPDRAIQRPKALLCAAARWRFTAWAVSTPITSRKGFPIPLSACPMRDSCRRASVRGRTALRNLLRSPSATNQACTAAGGWGRGGRGSGEGSQSFPFS